MPWWWEKRMKSKSGLTSTPRAKSWEEKDAFKKKKRSSWWSQDMLATTRWTDMVLFCFCLTYSASFKEPFLDRSDRKWASECPYLCSSTQKRFTELDEKINRTKGRKKKKDFLSFGRRKERRRAKKLLSIHTSSVPLSPFLSFFSFFPLSYLSCYYHLLFAGASSHVNTKWFSLPPSPLLQNLPLRPPQKKTKEQKRN